MTRGTGMGVALLLNRRCPQKVNLMVSHSWEENAGRFFDDLLAHMRPDEVAFVCFLALYQAEDGMGPYIIQQLGTESIEESPFMRVMISMANPCRRAWLKNHLQGHSFWNTARLAIGGLRVAATAISNIRAIKQYYRTAPDNAAASLRNVEQLFARGRMLVVPNEELRESGQGLYSRLWCVFEVCCATQLGLPIYFTDRSGPEYLYGMDALNSGSKYARCGDPAEPPNNDERRIRAAIESYPRWMLASYIDRARVTGVAGEGPDGSTDFTRLATEAALTSRVATTRTLESLMASSSRSSTKSTLESFRATTWSPDFESNYDLVDRVVREAFSLDHNVQKTGADDSSCEPWLANATRQQLS